MKESNKPIPPPASGGLALSYKCNAECLHCMYACGPKWPADWVSDEDLRDILSALSRYIEPAPGGPDTMSLSHGLHFTGGEPFINYKLLTKAVEIASEYEIPSTFVETNCFWCRDDSETREKLATLKEKGLVGIMISVNPFYLEFVPFEHTKRCIAAALDVFGSAATMVYQTNYYHRFERLGIKGKLSLEDYLQLDGNDAFCRDTEFFTMGRAAYALPRKLEGTAGNSPLTRAPAEAFYHAPCTPSPVRPWHNHFDNYGNYTVGFCCGVSYGDIRDIDRLLAEGVDPLKKPVLALVMDEDIGGLLNLAVSRGYSPLNEGYLSKCHLCMDARKHLAGTGEYEELRPREFYEQLS